MDKDTMENMVQLIARRGMILEQKTKKSMNLFFVVKVGRRKEPDIYVFLFSDDQRAKVIKAAKSFAENPELSFSWYDAEKTNQEIRKRKQGRTWQRKTGRDFPKRFHL